MKSLPVIPFLLLIIFCSCSARKREKPAILQEKKIDVSSIYKKRGADLVEALYEELVSNSNELKKLEQEIKSMKATFPDSLEAFKNYHEKSIQYYESAEKKAKSITDSALRNSVLDFIDRSRRQYNDSTETLSGIDSLVKQRAATIENLHQALKLMSTLPVIEDFQRSNRPDTFAVSDLTRRLDEVIARLDSLTGPLKPQSVVVPDKKK